MSINLWRVNERTSQKLFAEITDYTSMRLIFVCVHMCVYGTHELVCVYVEARGQPLMLFPKYHVLFDVTVVTVGLSSDWESPSGLGWLAGQRALEVYLSQPSRARIASVHYSWPFSQGFWRSNTSSFACEASILPIEISPQSPRPLFLTHLNTITLEVISNKSNQLHTRI